MYLQPGFNVSEILDVCERIHREASESEHKWPPILGLYRSVVVTLAYLRRNRVQAELAETYGVSQPTISRAISAVTPLLEKALRGFVPTAEELDPSRQYVVDGTLLPCWSWAGHPELYSGKHTAPRRRPVVYPTQSGGIGGIFLGLMPNLAPKGQGNSSMVGNRRSCLGVWNEAPGRPARYGEQLDCLNPNLQWLSPAPIGKTPETDAIPCVDVLCSPTQPPEDGAISSEDIQGDEWGT